MPTVVAHKCLDWRQVDCRRKVDRVERSQSGLFESPGYGKQSVIDGEQGDRFEEFLGSLDQLLDRQPWFVARRSANGSRDLSQSEPARDDVVGRDETAQARRLRLVTNELDER